MLLVMLLQIRYVAEPGTGAIMTMCAAEDWREYAQAVGVETLTV